MAPPSIESVSAVVSRVANVPAIGADDDIFEAGLSSVDALRLLLELESAFNVAIPDDQFVDARTPRDLTSMIGRLSEAGA